MADMFSNNNKPARFLLGDGQTPPPEPPVKDKGRLIDDLMLEEIGCRLDKLSGWELEFFTSIIVSQFEFTFKQRLHILQIYGRVCLVAPTIEDLIKEKRRGRYR